MFPQGLGVPPKARLPPGQAVSAAKISAEPMLNTQRRTGHEAPSRIAPQTSAMYSPICER